MAATRILLLYISNHSGHHQASLAIERALRALDPGAQAIEQLTVFRQARHRGIR